MIDAHTLEILEFGRVLDLAARHAASVSGAEWVRALVPSPDGAEVAQRLAVTDEVRRLRTSPAGFPPLEFPELSDVLDRLEAVGVVLDPDDLRGLAALAALARRVRDRLKDDAADFPLVAERAAGLVPAPQFERAVAETFGPHDEVLDSASPVLKQVRRSLRQQREKILGRLESISPADRDRTVTMRADRYVVAVRAAEKSEVGGIVHDRSGSGATVYLEPFGLVEENNRLIELLSDEREEVRRILAHLSDMARDLRHGFRVDFETLTVLDGYRALAGLAEAQRAVAPRLNDGDRLVLKAFRHPLLATEGAAPAEGRRIVPLDFELSGEARVLLVTGPNMGGKTVALKGVGLACVMAAVGMHLPAAPGTELPVLENLVADVGDEQSIQNDLSTFASHLRRWVQATEAAGPRSLVLLDEIGAGTDPAEGAALAQAVLEKLADSGGLAMATTHLGALKRFASHHPGVVNGSMRFDPATERPLYLLDRGLPGQSRAIEMAKNLGLPPRLVGRAKELVGREEQDVQALLSELESRRMEAETELKRLEGEARHAAEARLRYEERLHRLSDEYAALKQRGIREGQRVLDQARSVLRDAEKAAADAAKLGAREARDAGRRLTEARRDIEAARESIESRTAEAATPGAPVSPAQIRAGERLWAAPLHTWVTVLAPPAGGDKVRVERNGVRVELPVSALRSAAGEAAPPVVKRASALDELPPDEPPARKPGTAYETPEAIRGEVDLRGHTVEEALEHLEAYLDGATLGGLVEVRIIHGKGTGALRDAVRKWLSTRPDIVSHRLGEMYEGGTGVTVARLEE